jgi:hypothetical protein
MMVVEFEENKADAGKYLAQSCEEGNDIFFDILSC